MTKSCKARVGELDPTQFLDLFFSKQFQPCSTCRYEILIGDLMSSWTGTAAYPFNLEADDTSRHGWILPGFRGLNDHMICVDREFPKLDVTGSIAVSRSILTSCIN